MKKTALFITLVIEVAICIAICISVNTDKYTLWTESAAIVRDIHHPDFPSPAARANHPSHYYVFIYSGKSRSLLFVNYKPKLNINDEITVKYNPENQFNKTAKSNSALYDFITNIKSLSLEVSQSNIERIWNISKDYSQIHCDPWYDGHNVQIEF